MAVFEVAKNVGGTTIGHHECTGNDSLVTFGSTSGDSRISQEYDHLMMTLSVRNDHSTVESGVNVDFNNGTGYSYTRLQAMTPTPGSGRNGGASYGQWSACAGSSVLSSTFAAGVIWVPNYSNSTNKKSWITRSVIPNDTTGNSDWAVQAEAGLWSGTDAITEIDLTCAASANFVQYSNFTLFGIKGS